ncbi:unnamed protein product, partial [Mesorhabditis spiculigera]
MSFEQDEAYPFLAVSREERAANSSRPFDSKKNCWVPDPEEGYIAAEIKETNGEQVTVITCRGNEVTVKKDEAQEMNPPKFDKTDDMANLTFLNEASVLANLRDRYQKMMIYTYSGLFCVVINPYKRLPIYTESVIKAYMGRRRDEMPPHLFATSDEAYRNMVFDKENQSMLITGESGAGKTENTKKVISYFAIVGATQSEGGAEKKEGQKGGTLEEQIVQTNPVLEAFGNAKTVRNNNSSRFGKFIRTHFSSTGKLAGGDIEHYLLEKSRVVRQAPGERTYHIFYQIMSGFDASLRGKLKLTNDITYYHFSSQAELTIEGVDDKEEMRLTQEAFDIMGFTDEEVHDLYKNTAGIMHMGEMKFKQRPREEQAEEDGIEDAQNAAHCFGVDAEKFVSAFVKPRVRVGTEWVNKGQNLDQVNWAVSGLAKAVYARMFHWIIRRCNKTLDAKEIERKFFIGVLDIAGFEIFDLNSFEQLWINFVNERLQQFFNHHMFVLEQEEYKREGIQWTFIDFGLDLQACIELIEKPLGIISMLDEECIVPKASDMTYVDKLNDQHLGKHPNFQKPKPPKGKQADAHFAIVHYAGTVRYNANNFLEKNKDPLNDSAVAVLKHCEGNALMLDLWADYVTQEEAAELAKQDQGAAAGPRKKGKSSSFMTVSMIYRESLNNLMNMLYQTHPHFIRCIIPNEKKASGVIDAGLVLNQLTCNGVLEGIRICRKGFPNRQLYADFRQRYAILAADAAGKPELKAACTGILDKLVNEGHISDEEFRVGNTKIFFKAGVLARLEDARDEILSRILTGFQCQIRWYLGQTELRRRYDQQSGLLVVQRNVRSWCTVRTWDWFKLFGRVKPLLADTKKQEEVAGEIAQKIQALETTLATVEQERNRLEGQVAGLVEEKNKLFLDLEKEKESLRTAEEQNEKLTVQKTELDRQLHETEDKLSSAEEKAEELQRAKKKIEAEVNQLSQNLQRAELDVKKAEQERNAKEASIRALQDEMANQDEHVARLHKEKKQQEEANRKLLDDLHNEEDKAAHLEKLNGKLQAHVDQVDNQIALEKQTRAELERRERKLEGELKIQQETIDELQRERHDVEQNLRNKEADLHALNGKLQANEDLIAKLQRQIKEQQCRISELEDELDNERSQRQKADRSRADLQAEIEDLSLQLSEAGGLTAAQVEANRRREAEVARIRRELEQQALNHETAINSLRKKGGEAIVELQEQLENAHMMKAKSDAAKAQLQRELEEATSNADSEHRQKLELEKQLKTFEIQFAELQQKTEEQNRQIMEYSAVKSRLGHENSELNRLVEDLENQLNSLHRLKGTYGQQLEEARRAAEEAQAERQGLAVQLRNFEHENESLRHQLMDKEASEQENLRQISKLNAEIQQWKARWEQEGLARMEEIEAAKAALQRKVQEMTEAYEGANLKIQQLEKVRAKLAGDLDDAQVDLERTAAYAAALERKQRGFDQIIAEWKKKSDDLANELDAAQRDNRQLATDLFKAKTAADELVEQNDSLRRENAQLTQEVRDLTEQLGSGGRTVAELQKILRAMENEKEAMQKALDGAEAALEAEEAKVLRAQIEISQVRAEIEKRLAEKEEEFENTRRNHQRAMESMQATLEAEMRAKEEALRIKKKLESDINELEVALDHANRANADAQRTIKKYIETVRELQMQIEEEQRLRDELNEQLLAAEKRNQQLQAEKDQLAQALDAAERARRQAEQEAIELREQVNDLSNQVAALMNTKRKLEAELQAVHLDLDEALSQLKLAQENLLKAQSDAARLAEELRQEQEHASHLERVRRAQESALKEMQARLDDAEAAALKAGKKIIQQMEARIRSLEMELDNENRKYQEADKHLRKLERRCKEAEFQIDEERKNAARLDDLIDKQSLKMKVLKRQADEAEEIAAVNLGKYRTLQQQMDAVEERAEMAENCLSKFRCRSRLSVVPAGFGLEQSASMIPLGQPLQPIHRSASMQPFQRQQQQGGQNGQNGHPQLETPQQAPQQQ